MYVIKHTDESNYVKFKTNSRGSALKTPVWVDDVNKATEFRFKSDAEITIQQFGIPYVTAVAKITT